MTDQQETISVREQAYRDAARVPVSQVQAGALELASLLTHAARLSEKQGVMVAYVLQSHIDKGLLQGKVVTGDHEEGGETVLDWSEL